MVTKDDFNHILNPNEELVVRANKLKQFIGRVKEITINCYSQEEYRYLIDRIVLDIFGDDDGRNV